MHLDSQLLDFIAGPVSIVLSARDHANRPSITRVYGCRPLAGKLRLFVLRHHADGLLNDIAQRRSAAAVFSHFRTFQTVQIKGWDAEITTFDDADERCLEIYRSISVTELMALGFPPATASAYLNSEPADARLVVSFTPRDIFEQTPGPGAGAKMAVTAA